MNNTALTQDLSMESQLLSARSISKSFGDNSVLKKWDYDFKQGQSYSIIGESGSGKTTCLKLLNGAIKPDNGEVLLYGQPLNYKNILSVRKEMGYSIQGSGLFPHLSIEQNLSIIAKSIGWPQEQRLERSKEILELLHLPSKNYLGKFPHQLSGGEKQRVGIARALFLKPKILLMDEPFGSLDPITRNNIQDWFVDLQIDQNLTVIMVTHDLNEAFKMSQEVILLNNGSVVQSGNKDSFYNSPSNEYVKGFVSAFRYDL